MVRGRVCPKLFVRGGFTYLEVHGRALGSWIGKCEMSSEPSCHILRGCGSEITVRGQRCGTDRLGVGPPLTGCLTVGTSLNLLAFVFQEWNAGSDSISSKRCYEKWDNVTKTLRTVLTRGKSSNASQYCYYLSNAETFRPTIFIRGLLVPKVWEFWWPLPSSFKICGWETPSFHILPVFRGLNASFPSEHSSQMSVTIVMACSLIPGPLLFNLFALFTTILWLLPMKSCLV